MSHHKQVSIVLNHPHCVGKVLALLHRCSLGLREPQSSAAEPGHGRLETQPGPSARLEEQCRHYLTVQHLGARLDQGFHYVGCVKNVVNVRTWKVADRDNVSSGEAGQCGTRL